MLRIAAAGVETLRAGYTLHVLVRFSLEPRIAPATHLCKERAPQDQYRTPTRLHSTGSAAPLDTRPQKIAAPHCTKAT